MGFLTGAVVFRIVKGIIVVSLIAWFFIWKKGVERAAVVKDRKEIAEKVKQRQDKRNKEADIKQIKVLERNAKFPIKGDSIPPKQKLKNLFQSFD